jgi:hypothetical protein
VTFVALDPQQDAVLSASAAGDLDWTPCEPCRPIEELKALARRRVTRRLTSAEQAQLAGRAADG